MIQEKMTVSGKILLIGAGNMGFAMMQGWVNSGVEPGAILAIEPHPSNARRAASLGVEIRDDIAGITTDIQTIILAVKPQNMREILTLCQPLNNGESLFVSVAAGVNILSMAEILGTDAPIIRVMPNTPALVGAGMMVYVANENVSVAQRNEIDILLASVGKVCAIEDEGLMDAVTAISGSGPAYLFHFIEALQQAGEKLGLTPELARQLAVQTIYGSAKLAYQSGEDADILRANVTSPNGTTEAALNILMGDDALHELMFKAASAARKRSHMLAKES